MHLFLLTLKNLENAQAPIPELAAKFNSRFENNLNSFHPSGEIELPPLSPPIIYVVENGEIETLARAGSLVIITSKAKVGKTGVLGALIAGAIIANNAEIDTLGINVKSCPIDKVVVHIDTESSQFDYYRNLLAVTKRANFGKYLPDKLKTICLRTVPIDQRLDLIENLIDDLVKSGAGIHAIFLDGLTDLLTSINDESIAITICEKLLSIADRYETAIISIIHENQKATSGGGARGWLGSQLERKVSAHFSITKNDDGTRAIEFLNCRECGEITPRLFEWDKENLMFVSCGVGKIKKAGRPSKFTETEIEEMKSLKESGLSNKKIAVQFGTTHQTIANYLDS